LGEVDDVGTINLWWGDVPSCGEEGTWLAYCDRVHVDVGSGTGYTIWQDYGNEHVQSCK
jgi:hypothetical protein